MRLLLPRLPIPSLRWRRPVGLLALLPLTLAACAQPPVASAPVPAASGIPLRLMAVNDFHGHLEEEADLTLTWSASAPAGPALRLPTGGAPALAGLVQALRAQVPHSLFLSSGDLVGAAPLVSSLFRHESTVTVMNQIGLDLGIPGNHEFDAGQTELLRLLKGGCAAADPTLSSCATGPYPGARFPLLAANVVKQADGQPLLAPALVRTIGGVKVGFIGAVTRHTPAIVVPSGVAGLRFTDEAEAINRTAAALQAQGVQALVALVHEGGELDAAHRSDWNDERCPGASGAIFDMARRITPAVDVVFSAHTHQGYRCLIDGRPVVQAGSYGRGLAVVDLVLDPVTGDVDRAATRSRNLPVLNDHTPAAARARVLADTPAPWHDALAQAREDAGVAATVARYAALAAPQADRPVGRIGGSFTRAGATDSTVGRLVADAQLAATRAPALGGAQIALTNRGGLRSDLLCHGTPPCPVSFGEAFTLQPFGNSLVVMTLTGAELKALLENQAHRADDEPHWLQPSASLQYRWRRSAARGQRVQEMRLNGQPITPDQPLRVVVNSYLAEGGDGFHGFRAGRERLGGVQDLQALVEQLARGPAPDPQPRITLAD